MRALKQVNHQYCKTKAVIYYNDSYKKNTIKVYNNNWQNTTATTNNIFKPFLIKG